MLAAARAGGIHANNTHPADFLYDNLTIAGNVIHAAHRIGVKKLLNLGSSCIYLRLAPQPIPEKALLTGPLESTNRAYAVAKIAAIDLCDSYRRQRGDDYISAMPTNLYGPNDNYDPQTSHVLAALLRKIHEAKQAGNPTVTIWGTGTVKREFLHVDDLANAALHLLEHVSQPGPINVGTGKDTTINDLATLIANIIGYHGEFVHDTTKPDGTPQKLLDVSHLKNLGWQAKIGLRQGIERTYQAFLE